MANITQQDVLDSMLKTQTLFNEWGKEVRGDVEDEKLELRHGDYGLSLTGNHPRLYVYDKGIRWVSQSAVKGHNCVPENLILGNIFDDLKAMAEDIEVFKIGNCMVAKLGGNGELIFNCIRVEAENLPACILGIRQLQATAERQKNG